MPRAVVGFKYGLVGYIHSPDHNPPHIHIKRKGTTLASVNISNPDDIIGDGLTRAERNHVIDVVRELSPRLRKMWVAAQDNKPFDPIQL